MEPKKLLILITALVAIGMGAWLSYQLLVPAPAPKTATILPSPPDLPEFSLLDQVGRPFRREDFAGQWSLAFFGFTHCPDICPLTLQVLSGAHRTLVAAGQTPVPRIVFISVDPDRDTPEVIGQYVGHFGADIIGISGSIDELRKLTSALGIFFQTSPQSGENYSVDHSAAVLLIDPEGRFRAVFSAPHEIDKFVHDLPIIMKTL
jgi:protein SCO1/2